MPATDRRIVLFGATGYTGRLTAESLVRAGARPVLAGRNRGRLQELAEKLSGSGEPLAVATADVTDPSSVAALLEPGDVLISTVGPFLELGEPAVQAALRAQASYLDSTGEPPFVRTVFQKYGPQAADAGAGLLPAFGYDYVPGILAGALALADAPAATRAEIGYFATGPLWKGLSQGTRATMADGLTLPSTVWRDGRLTDVRTAASASAFTVHGRRRTAFLVSGTEVLALPRLHPTLREVEVYNGWFPPLSRAITVTSAVADRLARRPAGRRLVERIAHLAVGPAGGPDAAERKRTRTHAVARATDASGSPLAEVHVEGPSIYSLTGELLAMAAHLLATGAGEEAGVVTPIEAFGAQLLESCCADVGLARVPHRVH